MSWWQEIFSRINAGRVRGHEIRLYPRPGSIPALLSPGRFITDPDEAEALGLNVDARWMRHDRGNREPCDCCNYQPEEEGR